LSGMLALASPAYARRMAQFFDVATALADALAAAHRKHITHRDLKPVNVMVSDDGRVKVLDFGLARAAEPDPGLTRAALTQAGTIVGTMPYMSPEQLEAKPLDPRTDIFSLGIVLYEMATGRRPFEGDSTPALMVSILKDHPPLVGELRPDMPAGVSRLISRCLEKDRGERIQTAAEILAELKAQRRDWESGGLARPTPAAPRASPRQPDRIASIAPKGRPKKVLPSSSASTANCSLRCHSISTVLSLVGPVCR